MRLPEKIACDKRIHFLVGAVMSTILSLLISPLVTLLIVTAIGLGVEVYQKATDTGMYDNVDALYVSLGSLAVVLPLIIKGF